MTFHLAGGTGGITHMPGQFRPAFEAWWASMPTQELSEATCRKTIGGVAAERDAVLLPLLELTGGGS